MNHLFNLIVNHSIIEVKIKNKYSIVTIMIIIIIMKKINYANKYKIHLIQLNSLVIIILIIIKNSKIKNKIKIIII